MFKSHFTRGINTGLDLNSVDKLKLNYGYE